MWGDGALWYLIADANNLELDAKLAPGQVLKIPPRANTVHNDADTFNPYSAAEAIGDTRPTLPVPASSNGGCGGVGQLVVIVVAVLVTVYSTGLAASSLASAAGMTGGIAESVAAAGIAESVAAAGMLSAGTSGLSAGLAMTAGAIGGAVGSIASQVVGMAIGAQDGFSWRGVAMSALGGGASAGVASLAENAAGSMATMFQGKETTAIMARAIASNVATQAVSIATGLQPSFSWRSIAASAVGSGVGAESAKALKVAGVFGGGAGW